MFTPDTYFSIVFLEFVWALNFLIVHLVRQEPFSVRHPYRMKKSCKFDMSKINPRIDIVLAQDFHGNEVIQLRSEVNKGEIVPASVEPFLTIATVFPSHFRDAVSLVQEFFQTFGATSNGKHCSTPIIIVYCLDRHILCNKIPEHRMQNKRSTGKQNHDIAS